MRRTLIASVLVLLAVGAGACQTMTKYRVTAKADKHADFSKLQTYAWEGGWLAYDKASHEHIVAAIDREMAALGFRKRTDGQSDVCVVYATVRRVDVDLKSKSRGPGGERPTYPVATLVVMIREPGTHKELFRARSDTPIDLTPAALETTINSRVSEMFEHYPTRHSSHQ